MRAASSALKAAIVVSAAAILSQAQADLEANAKSATSHFDTFRARLAALRDGILRERNNAAALATISTVGTVAIDLDVLNAKIVAVDGLIDDLRRSLLAVIGSANRDGIDAFAERAGALGHAFQDVASTAGEPPTAMPFLFDQFFLETMADLGQRDWSDGA